MAGVGTAVARSVAAALLVAALAGEARAGPRQFARAFQRVQDAVVAVEARTGSGPRWGSGFVAGPGGMVVCASATVERAKAVRVHVGGAWHDAEIRAVDPRQRVALLQVAEGTGVHPVAVARDPRLLPETWIVAVERRRDGKARPVAGMVAEVLRAHPRSGRAALVVVDAPALAGSPLVNLKGEVVGLSLGRMSARRGRAIALEPVREFLRQAAAAP